MAGDSGDTETNDAVIEDMENDLPVILSQQIAPESNIKCIGVACGTRSAQKFDDAFRFARAAMYRAVRKMDGNCIIDPVVAPPVLSGSSTIFSVSCRVGIFTEQDVQSQSE